MRQLAVWKKKAGADRFGSGLNLSLIHISDCSFAISSYRIQITAPVHHPTYTSADFTGANFHNQYTGTPSKTMISPGQVYCGL